MLTGLEPVPLLDVTGPLAPLQEELDEVWRRVVASGRFIGGPLVEEFESVWADACGTAHAVGCANGTDAIELALRALGVESGDEVVVPDNTFVATAEAVVAVGAVPVFADVDPGTLLITPLTLEAVLTPRTAAVVVVHLYGQAADVPALVQTARRHGLAVVEDCAQAQGALWQGRPVGGLGDAGCFSFYPGKNLGAFGDAGAVVTGDPTLARRVRMLADHGRSGKHMHSLVGRNSRLDALQAGVLTVKAGALPAWNEERRTAHSWYLQELDSLPEVVPVEQGRSSTSVFHLEVVRCSDRDAVRDRLSAAGVETGVHYPVVCSEQPAFAAVGGALTPAARLASDELLSLPLFPGITRAQVARVAGSLRAAVAGVVELP